MKFVSFDARDAYAQAKWWCEVFGVPMTAEDEPGDAECLVPVAGGPDILFLTVPEPKTVKNRGHLDIEPAVPRDEELDRLLALGATQLADFRASDGAGWVVMADPEGNEFCINPSAAELEQVMRSRGESVDT